MADIDEILAAAPVMPVVTLKDADKAVPLARALVAGGLKAIEITLRTPAALDGIARVAREVPECLAGAGTVLSGRDLRAAKAAGAAFAISPGATAALLEEGKNEGIPYLPAVATASELMTGLDAGYHTFKLFPAGQLGGPAVLKSLGGPFPKARFCPTGGIDAVSAKAWLALPNVFCVGGSWVAPEALIEAGDFTAIEALARAASALRQ